MCVYSAAHKEDVFTVRVFIYLLYSPEIFWLEDKYKRSGIRTKQPFLTNDLYTMHEPGSKIGHSR